MTINGTCHCGDVTITAPAEPEWIASCQCSVCSKLGVLWAYYPDASVTISGATDTYVWNKRVIAFHRCKTCGCITHWQTLGIDFGRMGVNARLFDDVDLSAIETRILPGPAGPGIRDRVRPAE